jgi:EAL domain-containing protein (putative c-di-GMP-specific phosphodiesterase class I)
LYYQPIVDVKTETVRGVEALLRWSHAELGAVPPADFLPVAEDTGLIIELGEWVLRTACMQVKAWREEGLSVGRVSVNISVAQFLQSSFFDQVAQILAETGLPAEALELEITESLLMQHTDGMINTLIALKALGVSLAIDDFGQGYSSMAHLRALPIDRVKISSDFVTRIDSSSKDAAIVRAIIALAMILDLRVVAEGVETADHLRFLKAHGCAEAQGFHFGRPAPDAEVITRLKLPAQPANETPKILQA